MNRNVFVGIRAKTLNNIKKIKPDSPKIVRSFLQVYY